MTTELTCPECGHVILVPDSLVESPRKTVACANSDGHRDGGVAFFAPIGSEDG